MRALKLVLFLLALLAAAQVANGLEKHQWCFRKYGGGYGPPSNYYTPYRGWFGSPYYGGCNHAHWNRYGWGYDGLATHGR